MSVELERLQLAFAYHMVREVVGADTSIDPAERAWVNATFPIHQLREAGFIDPNGRLTPEFDEIRHQALIELPDRLSLQQKIALVEIVAKASAADGVLAPEETDAIAAVARMLGVSDDRWQRLLAEMLQSGALRRDATGW